MSYPALSCDAVGAALTPSSIAETPLPDDWIEVAVEHCGLCHSDLSMIDNEWRSTRFPLVPGHEIVGPVIAAGPTAFRVKLGDRVGIGWFAASCMSCEQCLAGWHNRCRNLVALLTGAHGGFASRVRCHWAWATPLPSALDATTAGPLFCGGITVFNPIDAFGIRATDRVAVLGIGGLGHLALKFLRAYGCEVTAFTSTAAKRADALRLGAHHAIASDDEAAMRRLSGHFRMILVTVAVAMPWANFVRLLAPGGVLHFVGAVQEPLALPPTALMGFERSIASSSLGTPRQLVAMLDFCARHVIAPEVERLPLTRANEAIARLRSGSPRYRIVLDNDLGS
jgi:uncharacterized zinc-type alcohol dehydrogenase-like protein